MSGATTAGEPSIETSAEAEPGYGSLGDSESVIGDLGDNGGKTGGKVERGDVPERGTAWGGEGSAVFATALFLALVVGVEISFGAFLVTYAASVPSKRGGVSQAEADLMTTTFWGVFTLGRLVVAAASRHVRPAPILATHLAAVVLSLIVVGKQRGSSTQIPTNHS